MKKMMSSLKTNQKIQEMIWAICSIVLKKKAILKIIGETCRNLLLRILLAATPAITPLAVENMKTVGRENTKG